MIDLSITYSISFPKRIMMAVMNILPQQSTFHHSPHAEGRLGISINLVWEANLDEGVVHFIRGRGRFQVFINKFLQVEVIDGY